MINYFKIAFFLDFRTFYPFYRKILKIIYLLSPFINYWHYINEFSKPYETPRKLLDVTRVHNLGWNHQTSLETGIRKTYEWFLNNHK